MKETLSVVIGRFQTPYLHQGHLELIEEAKRHSDNVLILLGCTDAVGTDKNPMDFYTRAKMLYESGILSNFLIYPLSDRLSDKDWSDGIDEIIKICGFEEAVIFGGRDNSIEGYYCGKHEIKIIEQQGSYSSTELRKEVAKRPLQSSDFRSGIIYHVENRYPIVYSTIDVAIEKDGKYLVGKKGDKYCFIGGFIDPADENLFVAAYREAKEETGIGKLYSPTYCGSIKIEDERYKGTKDCVMTHLISLETEDDVNYDKILDKEFKDFVWADKEELEELLHDFHKPLLNFI